ncbi:MAG: hypothetical protein A3G34_06270 [Candidatus Lindowbacteria bacterium RIFCSPLOWO2_12_FULL_62_27]|nr:MAG: hypothetical protein A3G34_06270 [Candidatus Lindowbacteria bacterium RIFCSPLOWO2_12_FULL_62_27]OGH58770.1 MAG: hypothetical protein A3I06_09660 [Candidatus Lindowbacteria bacterium RIFCSPLOWO2_02_FULL_62_12]
MVAGVMLFCFGLMAIPVSGVSSPTAETVAVTVYVGNGRTEANPAGLVLDTQTLILTESGTSTGIFRSALQIIVTDIDENVDDTDIWLFWTDRDQRDFSVVDVYSEVYSYEYEILRDDLVGIRPFIPSDRRLPAENKIWRETRLAGFDLLHTIFAIAGISLFSFAWAFYRRHFSPARPGDPPAQPEEKIARRDWRALSDFLCRHPRHPAAPTVAMELAMVRYRDMDYGRAADYFLQAIRLNSAAKNPEAHFYLAHCYRHLNYLCDAIDEWMACYLDDPTGPLAAEAFHEAQRWRARQIVEDTAPCPRCGVACRSTDLRCPHCHGDLGHTLATCGACGKPMVREAQICIHCLPDDIKTEVSLGTDWPILKTTALDWEAELIRSRLEAEKIPCVLTGEKGRAIPLTVGYLGEIHIRVPVIDLPDAQAVSVYLFTKAL